MERTTALSAAGAMTLTAAAAVSALFLTVDRGAADASEPATTPAVAEAEVITEYEVVTVEADEAGPVEVVAASTETAMDGDAYGEAEADEETHEDEHPEGEEPEGEYEHEEYEDEEDEEEDDD